MLSARAGWRAPRALAVLLAVTAAATPAAAAPSSSEPESLLQQPAAALREARSALAAGDLTRAEALLEAVADRHPIVSDYAKLLWLRALVESGRTEDAITSMAGREPARSPLAAEFFTLLGRAHAANGSEPGARAMWTKALALTEEDEAQAELQRSIGASFERSKELAQAANAYLDVWASHPISKADAPASAALERIEAALGRSVRTPVDFRKRGDALYRARHNERALAAYGQALESDALSRGERARAERQRAFTLFRLRRYPEAAAAFGQVPADDEMRIELARSHARAGNVPLAIEQLEAIGRRSSSRHAARANLLAGLLAEGEEQHERARELFEAAGRRGASTSYGTAALWRLGWAAYRAGRFEQAIAYFERLIDRPTWGPVQFSSMRPRYWRARALERLGRDGASEEFAAMAAAYPLSYYGWRASRRAGAHARALAPQPLDAGVEALSSTQLTRARILLAAGMRDECRDELDRLYPLASGLSDRLSLAALYTELGEFHEPERLMIAAYNERLSAAPSPEDIEVWWYAWPAPFEVSFRRAAELGVRVESGLVYAVMREESGYLADVLSVSGARGLLQIMPETGEELARSRSLPDFTPDDLFEPDTNIQLGSAYLEQLLERFGGRPSAAIASYNAGAAAVERWLAAEGPVADSGIDAGDDEWVEAIPYDQTRTYVKRVLRSLHVYRTLH